jgi:hypothetical protein
MHRDFKDYLIKATQSSDCEETEVIQSLWSDYGNISRYQLVGSSLRTAVVKFISLDQTSGHPRGWNTDFAHNRKVKSYEVETHWYENWNQLCTPHCRVPRFIGSFSEGAQQWIVLEDLDLNFPLRKQQLDIVGVKACLKWLANFHGTFLNQKPTGLWKVGTYWHLDTRPDELEKMEHTALQSKAHLIDEILNQCTYQTIIHGDAKLANFCFSEDGKEIAAVDFQYVGGGCGMKDVAYFLGSCLSSSECEAYEKELLDFYFIELQMASINIAIPIDFEVLEEEWRKLYPIACTDFMRFLLGWMPTHQKINKYNLNVMEEVLERL